MSVLNDYYTTKHYKAHKLSGVNSLGNEDRTDLGTTVNEKGDATISNETTKHQKYNEKSISSKTMSREKENNSKMVLTRMMVI